MIKNSDKPRSGFLYVKFFMSVNLDCIEVRFEAEVGRYYTVIWVKLVNQMEILQ